MKTRTLFPALAAFTLAGALTLTGCSNTDATKDPNPTGQGSDAASAFLACLTAAKVEAKINDQGMVLVKSGKIADSEGDAFGTSPDDGEILLAEGDEAGNTWIAPADADYFANDPDTQDAWTSCEKQHSFTQPQYDPMNDPRFQEDQAKQEEAALAFAKCARENGFTQIADPDAAMGGAVLIPDGFTESDFRALAEACYDPMSAFAFATSENLGFEPWTILEEFQNAPAS